MFDDVDVISHLERDDFVKLENPNPMTFMSTEKAVCIDGHWLPKVYVRCDFDGNLYVADWLYGKEWE